MSKKSYTQEQFDSLVASHKQQHGTDSWPSADVVIRELGGGKSTARGHLDAARTAASRPIAFSEGLLPTIEAAIAAEVRRAQDTLHAEYSERHAELRAATGAAEAAETEDKQTISSLQNDCAELQFECQHLAEMLDEMRDERDKLRADLATARIAEALVAERTAERDRLRGQIDLLLSQATTRTSLAPANPQAEPSTASVSAG